MRSEKQIAASRENGRKSHGAVSAEGKARIVAANLTSGIFAANEILPWEKAENLEKLKSDYYQTHVPFSAEARCLIDDLIAGEWTLKRLRNAEAVLWRYFAATTTWEAPELVPADALFRGDDRFARLQQRLNSTRLAYRRSLKDLRELEAAHTAYQAEAAVATEAAPATESVAETVASASPSSNSTSETPKNPGPDAQSDDSTPPTPSDHPAEPETRLAETPKNPEPEARLDSHSLPPTRETADALPGDGVPLAS